MNIFESLTENVSELFSGETLANPEADPVVPMVVRMVRSRGVDAQRLAYNSIIAFEATASNIPLAQSVEVAPVVPEPSAEVVQLSVMPTQTIEPEVVAEAAKTEEPLTSVTPISTALNADHIRANLDELYEAA